MDKTEYDALWADMSKALATVNGLSKTLTSGNPKSAAIQQWATSLEKLSEKLLAEQEQLWKEFNNSDGAE